MKLISFVVKSVSAALWLVIIAVGLTIYAAPVTPSRVQAANASDLTGAELHLVNPLFNTIAAGAAAQCHLRSDQWFIPFRENFYTIFQATRGDLASPQDRVALDAYIKSETPLVFKQFSCRAMLNSPLMDKLDVIHDRLTGGYR